MGFTALSIDIIFHKELGDLGRPETMDFFLKALQSGMLVGWVAGPPCETWSKARKHELPGGPRPVRSQQMPFGLQDLTYKEHIQVSIGSLLLGISFTLFWYSVLSGATAVIEHPAEVGLEPNDPSIWKLDVVAFFLRFSNVKKIRVLQGHYGGATPKATDLLILNGGSDPEQILVQSRTTLLPKTSAIGKNDDGSWQTAVLKQYPPDFCACLARLFEDQLHEEAKKSACHPNF